MNPNPRLRTDLVESRQEEAGQTYYIIKDPRTQRFFRLREVEHRIARLLDGQISLLEIAEKIKNEFGFQLPPEQLERFVDKLDELLFLESEKSEKKLAALGGRWEKPDKTVLEKILFVKLKAFDPDALITRLEKKLRFLFSPYLLALGGVLFLLAANVTVSRWNEFTGLTVSQIFRAESILVILIAVFGTVSLHEFAHALTLKHFGGEVHQMGFLLLYFEPCFYSDVSDAYLFTEKKKKILVTFAGVIFQVFLWSLSTLAWQVLPEGSPVGHLFFIASAFSLLTVLFNLNPLIKLDGYYILTDWAGIPNLRSKAFGYLKAGLLETAFGLKPALPLYSTREKRIFLLYGVLGLAYSVLILGYFFLWLFRLLTSAWRGAGFLLFSAFLLFIFAQPVVRTARKALAFAEKENLKKLSSTKSWVTLGLAVLFLLFLFFFPYPYTISGEAQVQPLAVYSLTMPPTGVRLIEEKLAVGEEENRSSLQLVSLLQNDLPSIGIKPKVKVGDYVAAAETVAYLASNLLLSELKSNQAALEQAQATLALLKAGAKPEELARLKEAARGAQLDFEKKDREFVRSQKLLSSGAISQEEFKDIKSERDKAEAAWHEAEKTYESAASGARREELQQARADISRLSARIRYLETQVAQQAVVSPIPGRVTMVAAPPTLVRIIRLDSMRIITEVPEADLELVQAGAPLELRLWGFPTKSYLGVVRRVDNEADEISPREGAQPKRFFKVTGVLVNSDGRLKGGLSGKVKIKVGRWSPVRIMGRPLVRFFKVEFWNWW